MLTNPNHMKKIILFLLLLAPALSFAQKHVFDSVGFVHGGTLGKYELGPDSLGLNGVWYSSAWRRKYNTKVGQVVLIPTEYNDKMSYPGCRKLADGLKPTQVSFLLFDPSSNVIYSDGGNVGVGGGGAELHVNKISSVDSATGNPIPTVINNGIDVHGNAVIDGVTSSSDSALKVKSFDCEQGAKIKGKLEAGHVNGNTITVGTGTLTLNTHTVTVSGDVTLPQTAVTTVTGTAPVSSSGGSTPAISMAAATGSNDGFLKYTDWNIFNGKQSAITTGSSGQYLKGDLSLGTMNSSAVGLVNVENTALSTWTGSSNITTVGKVHSTKEVADSAIVPGIKSGGNSSTALNIYCTQGNTYTITRTGNCTYTLIGGTSGQTLTILFTHEASSTTYSVAFSPQVTWTAAPTFTNTTGAKDIVVLKLIGSTWFGQVAGPFATLQ